MRSGRNTITFPKAQIGAGAKAHMAISADFASREEILFKRSIRFSKDIFGTMPRLWQNAFLLRKN